MEQYTKNLNEMQKKAVTTTEGPVLVLAGAGSGKTTVLVNRIAYIIDKKKINPRNIMAITFTNKAANEMKERIQRLIGGFIGKCNCHNISWIYLLFINNICNSVY